MAAQINYELDFQSSRRYATAEVMVNDSSHGYHSSTTSDLYQGTKQSRKEEIAKTTVIEAQVSIIIIVLKLSFSFILLQLLLLFILLFLCLFR